MPLVGVGRKILPAEQAGQPHLAHPTDTLVELADSLRIGADALGHAVDHLAVIDLEKQPAGQKLGDFVTA